MKTKMVSHAAPLDKIMSNSPDSVSTQQLNQGWSIKQRNKNVDVLDDLRDGWSSVTSLPSEIHAELTKSGAIPDFNKGFNEHQVQWIADQEWIYFTTFSHSAEEGFHTDLHLEGLDTYCTVYVNGEKLLEADNMLLPYVVTLPPSLLKSSNSLVLHFRSSREIAKQLEAKYGKKRAGSCNLGDPSRVYVRKAQYHWRWDWGPELMTVGPWRPITLKSYKVVIDELQAFARVSESLESSLEACVTLKGSKESIKSVQFSLRDSREEIIREENVQVPESTSDSSHQISWELGNDKVKLWWPIKYGEQALYTFEAKLIGKNGGLLDIQTQKIGFRRVKLIQEPLEDAEGTTFLFEINGIRIFMGGSNWIPADTVLTNISEKRYKALLQTMVDGNQNMIRVWSGGIYEPQVFYDTCDELGILVWQDMCGFACGVYPAHESYVSQVTAEVTANIKLLCHHPSIVIWCGNNEDYQQVLQWGGISELPARKFYEDIFPSLVSKLTKDDVPYWFGSPYGGSKWYETADQTVGDVHEWHVWCNSPSGEFYQNYDLLAGRFISEFGLPSYPDPRTVEFWLDGAPESQRYPQSPIMAQHCKAGSFERRFANYMNENFRVTGDLESYAYLTQIMQSEGLGWAYRTWRRQWKGPGRQYTAGVLVWQLNDSWPVTSWALVDYFLRKKPAYYTVARELREHTVGIMRKVQKNSDNDRPRQFYEFGAFQNISSTIEIWVTNSTLESVEEATLEVEFYDLQTSTVYHRLSKDIHLLPNQTTEILEINIPNPREPANNRIVARDLTHTVVVNARLSDRHGKIAAYEASNWPEPFKYLQFPDPQLK
ncbi:hypothetical protein FRC02_000697, partial [Tulasnella sp. 418]